MERNTPQRRPMKRSLDEELDSEIERSRKRAIVSVIKTENIDEIGVEKIFKFRVLLPNGKAVEVKINKPCFVMQLNEFVHIVRQEYVRVLRQTESPRPQRSVNWKSSDLHFVDAFDNKIDSLDLKRFKPNKWNILRLQDGSREADTFENMWDLTPHTDLLKELPAEYTFETALADLIDNSLQAVWSNRPDERRLISVEMTENRIIVFDTGSGMDGSDENSIVKWGTMGTSQHRSSRSKAIGGKPPYLVPFFGMFGYGGPIASMHLGRSALVSSKTNQSKKVYMLHLERDALISCSSSENTWRTKGGIRDPSKDELKNSSNGSFTKVEIMEPKVRNLDIVQLQRKLKDIYFPYIQCDEFSNSGRTIRPIEFQVNGTDLAEIDGGEVATTNLLSCNGPEFTFQLCFTDGTLSSQGPSALKEANARVRCAYFPIVQGKERIDAVLEKLKADDFGITENYETFSRISIWWLGRLLPDARWLWLPFMDLRQRKGDKAQLLKRCCYRVKCFIETDAGFIPTPSKTDLAHQHPFTTELKNFSNKILEKDTGVHVEIYRDGKQISLQLLDRKYQEWILDMHHQYDEEIDAGEDEPIYVFNPLNKEELHISSNVLRIHKVFQRKGMIWKSGQKIKILKGACPGCHKTNVFAMLEYMIVEGCQGDAGGEARIICSPAGLPREKCCLLSFSSEGATIEIRDSISIPISVIDSGKFIAIGDDEWNSKLERLHQKVPSSINLLSAEQCREVEIGEALPMNIVEAGHGVPKDIVAVIRPTAFDSASDSKCLDQKYIVKEYYGMNLDINFEAEINQNAALIYSCQVYPSSHNRLQGLYVFSLKETPNLFEKAGVYTFLLSLKGVICRACEKKVEVRPSVEAGSWKILNYNQTICIKARAGSLFPTLSFACYDRYNNRIPFQSNGEVLIKFCAIDGGPIHVCKTEMSLSEDKLIMIIKELSVESSNLDKIRPKYEAVILISPQDESFIVRVPCQVIPGALRRVKFHTSDSGKSLFPGQTIKDLEIEMFDAYGNHLRKNETVQLQGDGFCFQDDKGCTRKVDERGYVNLSGILKVTKGFGGRAMLSVLRSGVLVSKQEFQIDKRELRTAFQVPELCAAGSQLENMVFEVITSDSEVDKKFNDKDEYGNSHTLTIKSDMLDVDDSVQYAFRQGRCTVRAITLPYEEGVFSFVAAHSRHPELHLSIEVRVELATRLGHENITSQSSDGNVLLLQASPALITPIRGYNEVEHESSDGRTLLLPAPCSSQDVIDLIGAIMNDQKELYDDMCEYGLSIGQLEKNMETLKFKQQKLERDVCGLQDLTDHDFDNAKDYTSQTEIIIGKINSNPNSAAAVVCKLFGSPQSEKRHREFTDDILGVVAVLGTLQSNELSRIFAQYLGEDQMLAVVCKSFLAACAFENYGPNGRNNNAGVFYEIASSLGYSVKGPYVVICLEDVRPFTGRLGRDPQRKLPLLDPKLPNGRQPPGYLGYAVNMIHLDAKSLQWRTADGHGLRETLFYRLFGQLQVYENRECMLMAKSCITEGAVSLDGGIIRGNGIMSFGYWEPGIQFPVISAQSRLHSCPRKAKILKLIEEKNRELNETRAQIEEVEKIREKTLRKFYKKRDRCKKFVEEKGPFLRSLHGFYDSQPADEANSNFTCFQSVL